MEIFTFILVNNGNWIKSQLKCVNMLDLLLKCVIFARNGEGVLWPELSGMMHSPYVSPKYGKAMNSWLANIISVFLISVIVTGILIPQILLIAFRKQLFDEPDERKIHKSTVPRLGGFAFFPAILMSIAFVAGINVLFYDGAIFGAISDVALPVCFGLCSLLVMYLVGMADDLVGLRYRAKFWAQIIAGVLVVTSGVVIDNLHGFFLMGELPLWIAMPFTVFTMVLVVNAVNLIDGIDGLASGLSAIALLFYCLVFYIVGDMIDAVIAIAAFGTLVPFFYYNVFGEAKMKKKIFMGDTGALTTGTVIGILMIKISVVDRIELSDSNPIVLAFSPLIVPCFDVVRVYFHRLKAGRNPFLPDKSHIHHKFLALGLPQRVAMPAILVVSMAFVCMNIALSLFINSTVVMLVDMMVWVVFNMWLTRMIRNRENRLNIPVEKRYN